MVLIDVHRKNLRKRKRARKSHKKALSERISVAPDGSVVIQPVVPEDEEGAAANEVEMERRHSFSDQDDILPPVSLLSHQRSFVLDDVIDLKKPELTIYSEEGIADMDLPDNILFDDLDYLDNITSCNKVENCLMLSEYEQNLIKETEDSPGPSGSTRRGPRKWSLFRQPTLQTINSEDEEVSVTIGVGGLNTRVEGSSSSKRPSGSQNPNNNLRELPKFPNPWRFRHSIVRNRQAAAAVAAASANNNRPITVIEEASVWRNAIKSVSNKWCDEQFSPSK